MGRCISTLFARDTFGVIKAVSSSCLLLFFLTSSAVSQADTDRPTLGDSMRELTSFFAPLVFPKVVQDDYLLRQYIRSEEFAIFRLREGDLRAVDVVFAEAMRLSWNNAYEALLITLLATMDHRRFGVKVPLLGPIFWVPLTSEFPDEFNARVAALPKKLYDDSPGGPAGDRDKLQHFFGSAFLSYVFESREPAERIGEFIEWGEDNVIVDGALDERDFRANRHGQDFGLALLRDKKARPSTFFLFALARREPSFVLPEGGPCGFLHTQELR